MSQEPQQPYQQPYTPYSQGAYPNPYAQFQQQRNHTTRNVLLVVGAVVLLFCGGIVAFIAWAISNVDDAFDSEFRGSEDDPLTVAEGQAFSIRGFDYAAGWEISANDPTVRVTGLRTTNNREDEDSSTVQVHFDLYRDNVRLASLYCIGGGGISFGRTAQLSCLASSADVTGYDEIEVYDASAFE